MSLPSSRTFSLSPISLHLQSSVCTDIGLVQLGLPLSCVNAAASSWSPGLLSYFHAFLHAVARAFFLKLQAAHTEPDNSHCPLGKLGFLHTRLSGPIQDWALLTSPVSLPFFPLPAPSTPNSYPNYFRFQSPEYACSLNVVFPPSETLLHWFNSCGLFSSNSACWLMFIFLERTQWKHKRNEEYSFIAFIFFLRVMVTAENTGKQTQKKLISFNSTTVGILVYNVICLTVLLSLSFSLYLPLSFFHMYEFIHIFKSLPM